MDFIAQLTPNVACNDTKFYVYYFRSPPMFKFAWKFI